MILSHALTKKHGIFWYNAHRRTEEEAAKQRAPGAADRRELSEKETQAQKMCPNDKYRNVRNGGDTNL